MKITYTPAALTFVVFLIYASITVNARPTPSEIRNNVVPRRSPLSSSAISHSLFPGDLESFISAHCLHKRDSDGDEELETNKGGKKSIAEDNDVSGFAEYLEYLQASKERIRKLQIEANTLRRRIFAEKRRTKPDFALIGEYRRQTWNANLDRQMLIVERATAIVKHVDRTKDEEKAMRSLIKVLRGMTKSLGNMFKTAERYDEDRGELVTYSLMDDPATKALFDALKKDVDEKIAKLQRLINLGTC